MSNKIHILVVDDHQVVREGIVSLLEENDRMVVLGTAANGEEALARISHLPPRPLVVLMDINMPILDGIAATERMFEEHKDAVRVLALTMVNQELYIQRMLSAGAYGYLLKDCDKLELYQAIEAVHGGNTYFSPEVSQTVLRAMTPHRPSRAANPIHSLSKRELEVLALIVQDLGNQDIADRLFISPRTVESHKQNLLSKTGVKNVAGLVVYAIKHGLVDLP